MITTNKLYWVRAPGVFANKFTSEIPQNSWLLKTGPTFSGTVSEWYETLVETIKDASNILYSRNFQQGNVVEVSNHVYNMISATVSFIPFKETELPKNPQPTALKGVMKGKIYGISVFLNDQLPSDQAVVKLISNLKATSIDGVPSGETIKIGNVEVQTPVVPDLKVEELKEGLQILDEVTVCVLE